MELEISYVCQDSLGDRASQEKLTVGKVKGGGWDRENTDENSWVVAGLGVFSATRTSPLCHLWSHPLPIAFRPEQAYL